MRISDWSSDVCSSDLASTHADYADLRNWSLFEPQFGLCGQPLVHLFEAVVNDGPSLIRTRKPVGASTVRFDALCMNPDVRFLFQRLQLVMDLMNSGWPSRTYPGIQIGRASCRDRVCQYVYISVVAV